MNAPIFAALLQLRAGEADELRAELENLQSPAPSVASVFDVRIKFTDGTYRNQVAAANAGKALGLALTDARMGSPFGTFFGAWVGFLIERMQV